MGSPSDLERLSGVLALFQAGPAVLRRVRVGDIEVEFLPPSHPGDAHTTPAGNEDAEPEKYETEDQRKARAESEFESIMYGSAGGGHDFS